MIAIENKEAKVVAMVGEKKTFREIGEVLGISRQRAHQIWVRWHNQQIRNRHLTAK